MNLTRLREMLLLHEGIQLKPYVDTEGYRSIGVGRNLDQVGISKGEAMYLLESDIATAFEAANARFPWFCDLDDVRQEVVLNMIFNLGMARFMGFQKMISAMGAGQYELASKEMLKSKWAKQVGERAQFLSRAMASGAFDEETS